MTDIFKRSLFFFFFAQTHSLWWFYLICISLPLFLVSRLCVLPSPSLHSHGHSTAVTHHSDAGVCACQPLTLCPGKGISLLGILHGEGGHVAWPVLSA